MKVGKYSRPEMVGYRGWIEGKDWIVFIKLDGALIAFGNRTNTGKVLGDPVKVKF